MHNGKKLEILKYGIWSFAVIWVLFDLARIYSREPITSEAFVGHLIWAVCIPLAWWMEKWFFRGLYSEVMFSRGRKIMAGYRSFNIYFCAFGALMAIGFKLFMVLSGEDVEFPVPALSFIFVATAFYFSLLSRIEKPG